MTANIDRRIASKEEREQDLPDEVPPVVQFEFANRSTFGF